MELEFDKEIDAILRKARDGGTAVVTAAASPHLDADAIAAFAENALPDKARSLYMEHFADCDRCRRVLSQSILTNTEADATAASSVVSTPAATPAVSWFDRIFRSPNFALAMGALVLAFTGVLGYLAIQNRSSNTDATISKVTEPRAGAPYRSDNQSSNSSSNSANTMPAANAPAANSSAAAPTSAANAAENLPVRAGTPGGPNTGADKDTSTDGVAPEADKPVVAAAAPPPQPIPMAQPKTEVAGKPADEEKMKEDSKSVALASRDDAAADRREGGAAKAAKRTEGPSRASGQVQQQEANVYSSNVFDNTATKQAGGKKFNLRNGVWYDVGYHGQRTTIVRRGTDAYTKLDSEVRSIAESVGGTVVVVWKEKAYRIQ